MRAGRTLTTLRKSLPPPLVRVRGLKPRWYSLPRSARLHAALCVPGMTRARRTSSGGPLSGRQDLSHRRKRVACLLSCEELWPWRLAQKIDGGSVGAVSRRVPNRHIFVKTRIGPERQIRGHGSRGELPDRSSNGRPSAGAHEEAPPGALGKPDRVSAAVMDSIANAPSGLPTRHEGGHAACFTRSEAGAIPPGRFLSGYES